MARNRRSMFAAGTALVVSAAAAAVLPAAAATSDDSVSVILLTVDALHPDELDEVNEDGSPVAPNLVELRDGGTTWTQARAVMSAETLPNHVAMQTGTYPGFTGIPGNDGRVAVGDADVADPDLGIPELREAVSVMAAIETQCPDLTTANTLSKEYVWRTFQGEADIEFDQPSNNVPESGHALEATTAPHVIQTLQAGQVDHYFINLGDHDRGGHIDATGAVPDGPDGTMEGLRAEQRAALGVADTAVGQIVDELQASGAWERTVLMIASDHSMDFSIPPPDPRWNVDVGGVLATVESENGLEEGSALFGSVNGGAYFVYLVDPSATNAGILLQQAYDGIAELAGVDLVLYREPNPADPDGLALSEEYPSWNLHQTPRVGEIAVFAEPAYRMGSLEENQVPGNHGHVITRHSTAIITGGWDGLAAPQVIDVADETQVDLYTDTERFPGQVENVDWGPTVGWLLGVEDPGTAAGGEPQWRGRVLEEAFDRRPGTLSCAEVAGTAGDGSPTDDDAGDDTGGGSLAATGGGVALAALLLGAGGVVAARRRDH